MERSSDREDGDGRAVVRVQGLSKAYGGSLVLDSLDLTVRENSIFGFLGPNGAGKSTTIKLLLGLIRPSAGGGTVFDHDIIKKSLDIRARVGYLPQDPRFYDAMSARQTLTHTAGFYFKGPKPAIRQRVEETLALVGLADKADRPIKGFSGGERQRLGIAQAQVHYPDLLILDEPAASLDPLGRRDVLEVMNRLRKYATIFYCTHILDDVQRVSDTVAILDHGKLISHGSVESLLAGSEGNVYQIKLKGDTGPALARLREQPWVSRVDDRPGDGRTVWEVSVDDAEVAESRLMPLIFESGGIFVSEFRRKAYDLEEVFVKLVEGGHHGRE